MPEAIVVDTSCLIALTRIDHLHLLQQAYGKIIITQEIRQGRKLAKKVTGTLAILAKAKQKGIIKAVKPYLDSLEKAEFRFDNKLREIILKSVVE